MRYPIIGDWVWDSDNKRIYSSEGASLGEFTFERPLSMNLGWNLINPFYFLNPINYATAETATKILTWVKPVAPLVEFKLGQVKSVGVEFPQYVIEAYNQAGELVEKYNAGWLAFGLMKNGQEFAQRSFRAELKQAGL